MRHLSDDVRGVLEHVGIPDFGYVEFHAGFVDEAWRERWPLLEDACRCARQEREARKDAPPRGSVKATAATAAKAPARAVPRKDAPPPARKESAEHERSLIDGTSSLLKTRATRGPTP